MYHYLQLHHVALSEQKCRHHKLEKPSYWERQENIFSNFFLEHEYYFVCTWYNVLSSPASDKFLEK